MVLLRLCNQFLHQNLQICAIPGCSRRCVPLSSQELKQLQNTLRLVPVLPGIYLILVPTTVHLLLGLLVRIVLVHLWSADGLQLGFLI